MKISRPENLCGSEAPASSKQSFSRLLLEGVPPPASLAGAALPLRPTPRQVFTAHPLARGALHARTNEPLKQVRPSHTSPSRGAASPIRTESPAPAAVPGVEVPAAEQLQASPMFASSPAASTVHELVEKIELFLRSQRPGLSLTVGGAFAAEVQVEKTGPGEVAVLIRNRRRPPKASDLASLREQLSARGLKLSALSLG